MLALFLTQYIRFLKIYVLQKPLHISYFLFSLTKTTDKLVFFTIFSESIVSDVLKKILQDYQALLNNLSINGSFFNYMCYSPLNVKIKEIKE